MNSCHQLSLQQDTLFKVRTQKTNLIFVCQDWLKIVPDKDLTGKVLKSLEPTSLNLIRKFKLNSEESYIQLNVGTIPSRNWKQKLDPQELKKIYLKLKNKNPFVKNRKVHYLRFNYLRLCMNLEKIGYVVKRKWKRGSKPPIYEEFIKVEMNREIYKDWSLDSLYDLKFHE